MGSDSEKCEQKAMPSSCGPTNELAQPIAPRSIIRRPARRIATPAGIKGAHVVGHLRAPQPARRRPSAKIQQFDNARGQDFNTTYASRQVEAHKQAIGLCETYANNGEHPT